MGSPQTFARLRTLEDDLGQRIPITRLESHRRRLAEIARTGQGSDKAAAAVALDVVENFQDKIAPGINKKYKAARNLYARSRKAETIQDAISEAEKRASGFENGLRVEFGKIARQKGKRKFFNKKELEIIDDLIKGDTLQNFSKLIGRFGFSEGRATNIIGGSLGLAAGGALGGPVGGALAAGTGAAFRKLAGKLTGDKAALVQSIIAGGGNSQDIVRAYLKQTPRGQRKAADLAELLSDPNIDLEPLLQRADKLTKDAVEIAAGRQAIGEAVGLATASAAANQQKLQEQRTQQQAQQPIIQDNDLSKRIAEEITRRQGGI